MQYYGLAVKSALHVMAVILFPGRNGNREDILRWRVCCFPAGFVAKDDEQFVVLFERKIEIFYCLLN
jgi:hypothetical protein